MSDKVGDSALMTEATCEERRCPASMGRRGGAVYCVGPTCAAWRWHAPNCGTPATRAGAAIAAAGAVYTGHDKPPEGYCGLGGRP